MLSILICSLASRIRQRNELLSVLEPQVHNQPANIIIETDDGELSIGAKRNRLLERAESKYVSFIDDDDMVDHNYVSLILNAINNHNEPDCIGICGYIIEGGQRTWQFRHSITVSNWCCDRKNHIYFRTPNHLNPIKSIYAKQTRFPETSWGEDRAYSDAIRKYLKSEWFIEHPIYYYNQNNKK